MRAVVTRVSSASVTISGNINGQIGRGFLVLLGVGPNDIVRGLARTRVPGRMEVYRSADRQLTAIVQSGEAEGTIEFEARASGLRPARLTLECRR